MSAQFASVYGFSVSGPSKVPVADLLDHLKLFDGREAKIGGKKYLVKVHSDGADLYVALASKRLAKEEVVLASQEDTANELPVSTETQEDDPLADVFGRKLSDSELEFEVRKAEDQEVAFDVACFYFSRRRAKGVMATYRGAVPLSRVCVWISKHYRDFLKQKQQDLISQATSTSEKKKIKLEIPLRGSVEVLRLAKPQTFENELRKFASLTRVAVELPKSSAGNATTLESHAKGIRRIYNLRGHKKSVSSMVKIVLDYFQRSSDRDGSVYGMIDGVEKRVEFSETRAFRLGKLSYTDLVRTMGFKSDQLESAPIFKELKSFMKKNQQVFGP
jgi:hypothetical protein